MQYVPPAMESVIPSWDVSVPMPVTCTSSEALLAEDDATAEQRWQTLDDAGLDREIELHRRSLRALAAQLDSLSSTHPHGPSATESARECGDTAAEGGAEAAEFDHTAGDAWDTKAALNDAWQALAALSKLSQPPSY